MQKMSDEKYIRKRKIRALLTNVFYHMLFIFPVKKNKIVITTFEGNGGFCCNPRYIAEEILRRKTKYEIVWLVNNMNREFPKGIKKIRNTFLNRAYHLVTARCWIDNSRKPYGTAKRKKQLYVQTWHAALEFKPVGKFRGKLFPRIAYIVSEYDSKLIDYVTSNSEWCTKLYPEMLLYDGEIVKTGSARCDILINERMTKYVEIRKKYNIPKEAKIVMYAPTFRGGSQSGVRKVNAEIPTLKFGQLLDTLRRKFGGEWYVFLRLHPQLAAQMDKMPIDIKTDNMIDVSQADDMNEVLAAVDVFITDYSSSAFDAINVKMPVFLYADDLDEYINERGGLMWDLNNIPFSVAETNEKLSEDIMNFDEEKYKADVEHFLEQHGVIEDGKASKRIVDMIENKISDDIFLRN